MKKTEMMQVRKGRTDYIHVRSLMERIILQSIEDLWVSGEKDDCIDFFRGERFAICAYIAGLKTHDKARLIDLVNKTFNFQAPGVIKKKNTEKKKETLIYETSSLWNIKLSTTANQKNSLKACAK